MRRILFAVTLCAAAAAASATATAADSDGAYWSQRPESCRDFRRAQSSDERTPAVMNIRGWIAGYITAFNRLMPDNYDILGISDFETAIHSVDSYCKAHPLANLSTAMEALTEELYPKRHRTQRQAGR